MACIALLGSAIGTACPSPAWALTSEREWVAPLDGGLVRPFSPGASPFAAGSHRGIDLAGRRGQVVRSACSGRVAFAGRVAASPVVSVACGSWHVTHLPVDRLQVRETQRVVAGQALGSLGADSSHAGLHLGVRRAGRRFGYVDPWPLIAGAGPADRPEALPTRGPRGTRRVPVRPPRVGVRAPLRVSPSRPTGVGVAPPVAWLGLAVLLSGAIGAHRRASRRRAPLPVHEARSARTG